MRAPPTEPMMELPAIMSSEFRFSRFVLRSEWPLVSRCWLQKLPVPASENADFTARHAE